MTKRRPHYTNARIGKLARSTYRSWCAKGLRPRDIAQLMADLQILIDMDRDAVPDAPRSVTGSAGAAVLEG